MILAIDLGSSFFKLAVIGQNGEEKFFCSHSINSANPKVWEKSFKNVCQTLPSKLRTELKAICICANGPSLLALDKKNLALSPIILWHDLRFSAGLRSTALSFFLNRVETFSKAYPSKFAKTKKFICLAEYFVYQLTGEMVISIPHSDFIPYYWTENEIKLYNLEPSYFPPFKNILNEVGSISKIGSAFCGLPVGLKVFCGGVDFFMSLLGTGNLKAEILTERASTRSVLNWSCKNKINTQSILCLPALQKGLFNLSSYVPQTGRLHEMLKTLIWGKKKPWPSILEKLAQKKEIVTRLSFFVPPNILNCELKYLKLKKYFFGSPTDKFDFLFAFYEFLAFSLRSLYEKYKSLGCLAQEIKACGGLVKSPILCQLKADITGLPYQIIKRPDAELTGLAIIGACGLGWFKSLEEGVLAWCKTEKVYEPRSNQKALFEERYKLFKKKQVEYIE